MIDKYHLTQTLLTLSEIKKDNIIKNDILPLLDLTALNANDTNESILELCDIALKLPVNIASICIYPKFIKVAQTKLNNDVTIATVINFPTPYLSLTETLHEINQAIEDGAKEIDLVFPYQKYLNNNISSALDYITKVKNNIPNYKLKVILECSEFPDLNTIAQASSDIIKSGADFIKTSTGKTSSGASLDIAYTILITIKHLQTQNFHAGFKCSGGIKTSLNAWQYIKLAEILMGNSWVNNNNFRIGASSLIKELI